jgi:hypothetical protein
MFPRHAREHGQDEAAPEHDRQVDTQQAGRLLVRAGSFRLQRLEFREQTLATVEQPLAVGREAHLRAAAAKLPCRRPRRCSPRVAGKGLQSTRKHYISTYNDTGMEEPR